MTPQKQLISHDPDKGKWGDCYRTCVAVILDMKAGDVPHFCDGGGGGITKSREWLAKQGLAPFTCYYPGDNVSLEQIMLTNERLNVGVPYILTGLGPRGVNHSVVCVSGEIVCDPHCGTPSPTGLSGPALGSDGSRFWWVEVIARGVA